MLLKANSELTAGYTPRATKTPLMGFGKPSHRAIMSKPLSIAIANLTDLWFALSNRLKALTNSAVWREPLETMLHPSTARLRGFGMLIIANHVVSYLLLTYVNPHSFENFWLRVVMSASALPFIFGKLNKIPSSQAAQIWMVLVLWLQLPVMFSFMFVMNDGNAIRLASLTGVILIGYQVTDWRLASFGLVSGIALGSGLALGLHTPHIEDLATKLWILSLEGVIGLFLSVSRANLRHKQLAQAVTTMAVMAHEMRPAISTLTLVGRALRSEAKAATELHQGIRLKGWGFRLERLSSSLRSTVNNQVANAHLLELGLPSNTEQLQASVLVQETHKAFPYHSDRERECVQIVLRKDFNITSSRILFGEVLNNLLRNGLRAVLATQRKLIPGDLLLEVGVIGGRGRITVSDRGVGMTRETQEQAFDAFFTTDRRAGHGLGLTFCRQIIQAAGGTITVESVLGFGASFTLEFTQIESAPSTLSEDDGNDLDDWDWNADIPV